ncbi:MAG: hypothetical protein AB1921_02890 [Thermodesulfobacteriota bacterium]
MARDDIHILIADKNSKVSEFLRRELSAEGFGAAVAKDGRRLWEILEGPERTDLLILDPEILSASGEASLAAGLFRKKPGLPILLYAFDAENLAGQDVRQAVAVVEKEHDTEHLKKVVEKIARRLFPDRFV